MLYIALSRDTLAAHSHETDRPLPVFEHLVNYFQSGLRRLMELVVAHSEPPPCSPEDPCPSDDDDINPRIRLSPAGTAQAWSHCTV